MAKWSRGVEKESKAEPAEKPEAVVEAKPIAVEVLSPMVVSAGSLAVTHQQACDCHEVGDGCCAARRFSPEQAKAMRVVEGRHVDPGCKVSR